MNRISPTRIAPPREKRWTRSVRLAASLLLLVHSSWAAPVFAAVPLRLAIAPFSTDSTDSTDSSKTTRSGARARGGAGQGLRVAKALTARLALRDLERLIAPGAFVATAEFDPRAEAVRRWAYNASVEAIVVGRVSTPRSAAEGSMRVEAVVRSGHSGAELARHDLVVPAGAGLGPSMEKLAVAILGDLGQVDAPRLDRPGPPEVGARPATGDAGGPASEGRGLDADLEFSGFQDDAPIQIEAEEAEIISRDADRLLVFQRNVRVRQANIRLRSDRLEAVYERGESEPRKLVAQGAVRIDQDGRRASCDRAVYVRADQRLSCHGHAELVQGCDIVRGESIEFDLAGDRARVEGAASIVIQPGEDAATSCNATRGTL